MKKLLITAVISLALVVPMLQAEEAPSHLAIIAGMEGSGVKVMRFSQNDLESPAKVGMKLYDKDTVITPAKATCSLMFNTGDVVKVAQSSRMTVNMRPQDSKSLVSISRKLAAAFFTEDPDEDMLTAIGGVRAIDDEVPILLYPKDSVVLDSSVTFEWSSIPGAKHYNLTLTDAEGNVWTEEGIQSTVLAYPEAFPKLAQGEFYFWQVDVVLPETQKSSGTSTIEVASQKTIDEIEKIRTMLEAGGFGQGMHVILAMAYQKHTMMHDAIAEYQKLIQADPTSAYPYERLGSIYLTMGWKDRSVEALVKAVALDPESVENHERLAKLYEAVGKKDQAMAIWDSLHALRKKAAMSSNVTKQ